MAASGNAGACWRGSSAAGDEEEGRNEVHGACLHGSAGNENKRWASGSNAENISWQKWHQRRRHQWQIKATTAKKRKAVGGLADGVGDGVGSIGGEITTRISVGQKALKRDPRAGRIGARGHNKRAALA